MGRQDAPVTPPALFRKLARGSTVPGLLILAALCLSFVWNSGGRLGALLPALLAVAVAMSAVLFGVRNKKPAISAAQDAEMRRLDKLVGEHVRQRCHAEAILVENEARLKDFLENANDLVHSTAPSGRLLYVNRAWREALGYAWEELPTIDIFDVIDPDHREEFKRARERLMQGESITDFATVFRTKAGKKIIVSGSANCRFVDGKPVSTRSIFRDVTEQKRIEHKLESFRSAAERELREAKEGAVAANEAKSRFLAIMSHELRTPLNSVIGFANVLLKNKTGNLVAKELGYIERIAGNGNHLLGMINEILDLSKIEAGRTEMELLSTDLGEVVEEVIAQFQPLSAKKAVPVVAEIPDHLVAIETDPGKLQQVLYNLVANALRFTESGSIELRVITASETGCPVRIDVADSGIGIMEDRLASIFEPFSQADSSTARLSGGTGLGLAISRSLCSMMGYRLEVVSEVGVGSTFSVELDNDGDASAVAAASAEPAGHVDDRVAGTTAPRRNESAAVGLSRSEP